METSGLLFMFLLGLRHGFDPDHIAIIDGLSSGYAGNKPLLAKWTGTFFALGHGTVVTGIMVMISSISHSFSLPDSIWVILDFVPGVLLILVAVINFNSLKSHNHHHIKGWKIFFLPARLKRSAHPFAIILIGMLFAMVFDTSTQAAAWAYSATSRLTQLTALFLGISFSAGMVVTDSLDSRILFHLIRNSESKDRVLQYRKKLGYIIVFISLVVGIYKISSNLFPVLEISDFLLTAIGIAFFAGMLIFYGVIVFSGVFGRKNKAGIYSD